MQLNPGETLIAEAHKHPFAVYGITSLLVIPAVIAYLQQKVARYVVTTQRVVYASGIFTKEEDYLNLQKIEAVSVKQGVLGQLLGYGDVVITGTGGQSLKFAALRDPHAFKRALAAAAGV